jgi:hypothetical protein
MNIKISTDLSHLLVCVLQTVAIKNK